MNGARILLARRASGSDHAVVFAPDGLWIEGGFTLRRRIPYRSVHGLERAGAWLWLGTGLLAVGLGGRDVPPAQLAALEVELRARIAALPDGARRLARIDARPPSATRVPWLATALAPAAGFALYESASPLGLAPDLLFALAFALSVERWLGRLALLAAAVTGLGAASLAGPAAPASFAACGAAASCGLLAFARLVREGRLGVLARSALDGTALLALAFGLYELAVDAPGRALAVAALAGFALAPLVLRPRTP